MSPKTTWFLYTGFFTGAALLCFLLLHGEKSPDKRIVGKWKEVSWVYEKVNRSKQGHEPGSEINRDERSLIAPDLVIHEAETWEFRPDGKLLLHKRTGRPVLLDWRLKGRGHVLKLHYNNEKTEFYDLDELSSDKMTLYIDVEIQAKGIVRMTFEKIT